MDFRNENGELIKEVDFGYYPGGDVLKIWIPIQIILLKLRLGLMVVTHLPFLMITEME